MDITIRYRGFDKTQTPVGGMERQVVFHNGVCNRRTLFHLTEIQNGLRAQFVVSPGSQQHFKFADQRFPNAMLPDLEFTGKRYAVIQCHTDMRAAGKPAMEAFLQEHPTTSFLSDASNFPGNEGHFAIVDGSMLPLPFDSYPITGKHRVFAVDKDGNISFPIVDTSNRTSVAMIHSGFYVPQIIADGKPIGLLDEMPGTGQLLISAFRGHIGQIFDQDKYSEPNSPERAQIHGSILNSLRKTKQEIESTTGEMHFLRSLVEGKQVFLAGRILALPLATYNHTYWLEVETAEKDNCLYCLKTYPKGGDQLYTGFTFADTYAFLSEIAKHFNFSIRNAYVGCNGKTVRIVTNKNGELVPKREYVVGTDIGTHFDNQPLANFLGFYW